MLRIDVPGALIACCLGCSPNTSNVAKEAPEPHEEIAPATAERAAAAEPAGDAVPAADARARFEDLGRLCESLAHDYVDGTISDSFATAQTRTDWGSQLRQRAEASMTPGRELEKASRELASAPADRPAQCAGLFGDLDDLE